MKNFTPTQPHDRHRRVITTIYLADSTPIIVEVLEWGSGSTPILVRTVNNQILRQGIDASWSCYPSQTVALAFRHMRQNRLRGVQQEYGEPPSGYKILV